LKLKPKIFLLVVGTLLISLTALSVPIYWYTRSALEAELDKRLLGVLDLSTALLDEELLTILAEEPALPRVRQAVEQSLQPTLIRDITGVAVFSAHRTLLASTGAPSRDQGLLASTVDRALQDSTPRSVVSDIYRAGGGGYLKTAAKSIYAGTAHPVVLVVYGDAGSMEYIDQLAGTIFWVAFLTLIIATGLTLTFSRSLIRPVQQLSAYAKSIQRNLQTSPVMLRRTDELGDLSRALSEMHTELRENEQRSRELLSGIAHEIKNPLGGMEIYTGLLEEELSGNSHHREYLEKIRESLHNLNQTVISYLDYARPPRSRLRTLSVRTVLEDVHRLILPELRDRRVAFRCTGDAQLITDESKLRRVLLNLLRNGLEAVSPTTGAISVAIHSDPEQVRIDITDNGRGIHPRDQAHIFEPYYTTGEQGYGMGLAIAKNIVEEFDGAIFVHSEYGKGTTFQITFPREKS